jgi:hypothetical protein
MVRAQTDSFFTDDKTRRWQFAQATIPAEWAPVHVNKSKTLKLLKIETVQTTLL